MDQFEAQMASQGRKVTYLKVSTPDAYTVLIEYDASSPSVLIVVGVILGILAILAYFIDHIVTTVVEPIIAAVGPVVTGLIILGVIVLVVAMLYRARKL